jgi:hypothetical protein
MIIRLVVYEKTTYYKEKVFRVLNSSGYPLRTLTPNDLIGSKFLCLSKEGSVFVSEIKHSDFFGYYVSDIRHKTSISVESLAEFQLIEY